MRKSTAIALFFLLTSAQALANPGRVKSMITHGREVVVACAPMTCTEQEEARLRVVAQKLHDQTGGRVIIVTAPIGWHAEPYAAVGDQVGMGKKDVLLARSDKGWAARAPGLSPAMVQELIRVAEKGGTLEGGVAAMAQQLPQALVAAAKAPVALPPPVAKIAPPPKAAPTPAPDPEATVLPVESQDEHLDLWIYAGMAASLLVGGAAWWALRRRK